MEKSPRFLLLLVLCLNALLGAPVRAQDADTKEFLREIIRRHVRAIGHLDIQQKYSSFKAQGTMIQGDASARFTVFKRDGRLRFEVIQGEVENVLLYDGKRGWQWISRPYSEVLTALSPRQTVWLALEAQLGSILVNYEDLGFRAELVGLVTLPDYVDPLYEIQLRSAFRSDVYTIYLSSRNYLEIRREYRPAADQPVLLTEFSDYREVEGLSIPFRVGNALDDQWLSVTKLEAVQINVGVPGFFFKVPEGLAVHEQP